MARLEKKLWYVKREVVAASLKEAYLNKGVVYEIVLADENRWPENKKRASGFHNEKRQKD